MKNFLNRVWANIRWDWVLIWAAVVVLGGLIAVPKMMHPETPIELSLALLALGVCLVSWPVLILLVWTSAGKTINREPLIDENPERTKETIEAGQRVWRRNQADLAARRP